MAVFIPKMRQISDVKIDDGLFINPYSVFTIFSKKKTIKLSTTNAIFGRFFSINPNQLSQKEIKITHSHQGEKSNYNYNTREKIQLQTKTIRSALRIYTRR